MRLAAALLALSLAGCATSQLRRACIGAEAADVVVTTVVLRQGGTEANPLMRPAPQVLSIATTAIAILASDALRRAGSETAARVLLWGCVFLHGGAAAWNGTQIR